MRLLHICAAIAVAALLGDTWGVPAAAGVAEVLFDTRPESLVKGGATVPGPIQVRAEVCYPTSLPEAGRGLLRATTVSGHLLEWRRYGRRIGGSDGSAATAAGLTTRSSATRRYLCGLARELNCPVKMARAQTLALNGGYESCGTIHKVPDEYITREPRGESIFTGINGIANIIQRCRREGKLYSDVGVP